MESAGFPPSQSVLLIYLASKACLVYFIWLSEIPVSAQISMGQPAFFGPLFLADVEEWIGSGADDVNV